MENAEALASPVLQQRIADGLPTPFWDNRPEDLPPELERIRGAFHDLSTCRQIGMGLGPIPWTAIDRYAERHGVADFEAFSTLVRACDAAYLKAQKNG